MAIRFTCESCGTHVKAPAGWVGKKVKCPCYASMQYVPAKSVLIRQAQSLRGDEGQMSLGNGSDDLLAALDAAADERQTQSPSNLPIWTGDPLQVSTVTPSVPGGSMQQPRNQVAQKRKTSTRAVPKGTGVVSKGQPEGQDLSSHVSPMRAKSNASFFKGARLSRLADCRLGAAYPRLSDPTCFRRLECGDRSGRGQRTFGPNS